MSDARTKGISPGRIKTASQPARFSSSRAKSTAPVSPVSTGSRITCAPSAVAILATRSLPVTTKVASNPRARVTSRNTSRNMASAKSSRSAAPSSGLKRCLALRKPLTGKRADTFMSALGRIFLALFLDQGQDLAGQSLLIGREVHAHIRHYRSDFQFVDPVFQVLVLIRNYENVEIVRVSSRDTERRRFPSAGAHKLVRRAGDRGRADEGTYADGGGAGFFEGVPDSGHGQYRTDAGHRITRADDDCRRGTKCVKHSRRGLTFHRAGIVDLPHHRLPTFLDEVLLKSKFLVAGPKPGLDSLVGPRGNRCLYTQGSANEIGCLREPDYFGK